MGNDNGKLDSTSELVRNAKKHHDFIQELNLSPQLFHRNVVKFAIIRYEKYWLPFVATYIGEKLVAPLDIELIWVSHMLNPLAYEKDCFSIASRLIPHHVASITERRNNTKTKELWSSIYPADVSLEVDLGIVPPNLKPYHSKISSNLLNAVEDYRLFCRQVCLPHYRDDKFIQTAVGDYTRDAETGDLSRTTYPYHKGFIWKTHMLNPSAYRRDLKSLNERIVNRTMNKMNGGKHTRKASLYHGEFEEVVEGAMYRGEVAPLQPLISLNELGNMGKKIYGLRVEGFRLENLEPHRNYHFTISAKNFKTSDEATLLSFNIAGKGKIFLKTFSENSKNNFVRFDGHLYDLFHFHVTETRNGATSHSHLNSSFKMDFSFPGNQDYAEGDEFKVTFRLPLSDGIPQQQEITGWIKFTCEKTDVGMVPLSFSPDEKHMAASDHYCKILKYPRLMAPYANKLEEAPCFFLNMLLSDPDEKSQLKCRILQSNLGEFAAIEVLNSSNELLASAYTVGRESLPTEKQVSKPDQCCILRGAFETVFVLRSTNVDWALLKVFKNTTDESLPPSKVLFMNLKTLSHKWETLYQQTSSLPQYITYQARQGSLLVDLDSAGLQLSSVHQEFPELLSLGTAIITLFCIKKLQRMR